MAFCTVRFILLAEGFGAVMTGPAALVGAVIFFGNLDGALLHLEYLRMTVIALQAFIGMCFPVKCYFTLRSAGEFNGLSRGNGHNAADESNGYYDSQ